MFHFSSSIFAAIFFSALDIYLGLRFFFIVFFCLVFCCFVVMKWLLLYKLMWYLKGANITIVCGEKKWQTSKKKRQIDFVGTFNNEFQLELQSHFGHRRELIVTMSSDSEVWWSFHRIYVQKSFQFCGKRNQQ